VKVFMELEGITGTTILEHNVYEYAGIAPGNNMALWIVKYCEF
jgi:hypothetical protein